MIIQIILIYFLTLVKSFVRQQRHCIEVLNRIVAGAVCDATKA